MKVMQVAKVMTLMMAASIGLAGCGNDAEMQKLTTENADLKQQVATLQGEVKALKEVQAQATETKSPVALASNVTPTTDAPANVEVAPPAVAPEAAGYSDIAGLFGEQQIKELVRIGAIAPGTKFEPSKPVSRAQFVAWLVGSNNKMRPDNFVRLAEPSDTPSFKDVPTTHPAFKYIQGMMNAGWSIGYKDGTFRPDKALTREEMFGIKTLFDKPFIPSNDYAPGFSDDSKISADFYHAMSVEHWCKLNFERIYGQTKTCSPQKPVTRGEAAVCVSQIGYQPVVTASTIK